MRFCILLSVLLFSISNILLSPLCGQEKSITISEGLVLTKISNHTYIHTYNRCNGIIVISKKEAIIVSTPPSDTATLHLIQWVKDSLKSELNGYIIDRWHPDAMEGLDIIRQSGIPSYANRRTIKMAEQKNLPIPDYGFRKHLKLQVGDTKVVCTYAGPGHTSDGIVVWIPDEKILFGGNHIRNMNGWVGNIGDANIKTWSSTMKKVKKLYGAARVVIPGHGRFGDAGLLDYTIQLYELNEWSKVINALENKYFFVYADMGDILILAENESMEGGKKYFKNACAFIKKDKKRMYIESPLFIYDTEIRQLRSDNGCLTTYKNRKIKKPLEQLIFKQLTINQRDDEVRLTVIIRDMLRIL